MNHTSSQPTITLGQPIIGADEKEAINRVIDSGWLTMGPEVSRFESQFAELHGRIEKDAEAVAVCSCTAGLHLAMAALDLTEGDEVLLPSLTFVATANAVRYQGATPVFVDIESVVRPHISIEEAQKKLTANTKAIIVVHYGGYPVDMSAWRTFADENGLYLIEDAAHTPGAHGVGEFGDVTAFSFFSNKNMTTGEGGMVLARDSAVLERIRSLRAHGMTQSTLDRDKGHAFTYDVKGLGFNYRLDEMRAAMGQVQLSKLKGWNEKRVELSNYYRELIDNLSVPVEPSFDKDDYTVAHLFTVVLPQQANRQDVMKALRADGIQSSIHYPPIHKFSAYNYYNDIPIAATDEYCSRTLTLPLHPLLTFEDIDRVVASLVQSL